MHAALTKQDILHEIFSHIRLIRPIRKEWLRSRDRSTRACLLRAALTCRAFCFPALDALWKQLDSIFPLLCLLPAFRKEENGKYALRGKISPTQWATFDEYAYRVREIENLNIALQSIDPSTYSRLANLHRVPLVPHLRHFCWKGYFPFTLGIHILLSQTIDCVTVSIDKNGREPPPSDSALETFIRQVVDNVPKLRAFKLCGEIWSLSLDPVRDFKHLQELNILPNLRFPTRNPPPGLVGPVNGDAYRAFSKMESLVRLKIAIEALSLSSACQTTEFRSLEELSLSGPLPLLTAVLIALSAPHLTSVTLYVMGSFPSSEDYCSLLETLQFEALREISVFRRTPTGQHLDFKIIISPLMRLSRLERLCLELTRNVVIDDDDMLAMAMAWPEMKNLHLPGTLQNVGSLVAFARHCPKLHTMAYRLDGTDNVPLEPPIFSHGLKILKCQNLPANNLHHMARFIDCLFPNLDIQNFGLLETGSQELSTLLTLLQQIRRDHDKRRGSGSLVQLPEVSA